MAEPQINRARDTMEENDIEFKLPGRRHVAYTCLGVMMGMGMFLTFMELGFYKDEAIAAISGLFHPKQAIKVQDFVADVPAEVPRLEDTEANALLNVSIAPQLHLRQTDIDHAVLSYQKTLPVDINNDVRLDRVTAKPYQLEYTLTLKKYQANQMNTLAIEKAASSILQDKLCNNPKIRELMDNGLTVRCLYRGNNMSPLASVVIQNTNCLR